MTVIVCSQLDFKLIYFSGSQIYYFTKPWNYLSNVNLNVSLLSKIETVKVFEKQKRQAYIVQI